MQLVVVVHAGVVGVCCEAQREACMKLWWESGAHCLVLPTPQGLSRHLCTCMLHK